MHASSFVYIWVTKRKVMKKKTDRGREAVQRNSTSVTLEMTNQNQVHLDGELCAFVCARACVIVYAIKEPPVDAKQLRHVTK